MVTLSKNNKSEEEAKTVGTKLTAREYNEIKGLIKAGVYLSVSDFIREAVRDKLRATKVIKVREIDYDQAKKEVLGYYKAYKEAFPYQVAEDLELDYDLVWRITEELKEEGRLKVVQ